MLIGKQNFACLVASEVVNMECTDSHVQRKGLTSKLCCYGFHLKFCLTYQEKMGEFHLEKQNA